MIKNKGITLLELLIAMSLLILVLFSVSGIYLFGWKMFRNAQLISQTQRNAMVPMMHMVKHLQQAAKFDKPFFLTSLGKPPPPLILRFYTYTDPPNFNSGPTIISEYSYDSTNHQIIYIPTIGGPADTNIIGTHIHGFNFTISHASPYNGTVVDIQIASRDNNDLAENEYVLESTAEARYASVSTVY